jgi:4-amino-4-deoxy-L-arabinose transferase-like glycosyltransferase
MIGFARAASPDMLFAGLLTAAMAVAVEMLQKARPRPALRVAFGFFLGAAVLAKGPAAVILAGGAILLWAALSRQWRAPFQFLHPLIILVFCATSLPWYILCALRNPDFLRVFIWEHNFERYLTPIFEHRQPFWFFVPVLLLGIIPWLPLVPNAFLNLRLKRDFPSKTNTNSLLFVCWAFFTLLFFSISQSKLPGYILPAIPPTILLIAAGLSKPIEGKPKPILFAFIGLALVFPLIIGIALASSHAVILPNSLNATLALGLRIALGIAVLCGGLTVLLAVRQDWRRAICATASAAALLILLTNHLIMPGVDAIASARPAANWLIGMHSLRPDDVAVFRLPRAYLYGLDYYFNTNLTEYTPENVRAKIVFCSRESLGSQLLNSSDKGPATGDGKIFFVIPRRNR